MTSQCTNEKGIIKQKRLDRVDVYVMHVKLTIFECLRSNFSLDDRRVRSQRTH